MKKAQLSIVNVIMWFILVVINSILTYIMIPFINGAANFALANNQTLGAYVIYAIIPFYWIITIVALAMYASPQPYVRQF